MPPVKICVGLKVAQVPRSDLKIPFPCGNTKVMIRREEPPLFRWPLGFPKMHSVWDAHVTQTLLVFRHMTVSTWSISSSYNCFNLTHVQKHWCFVFGIDPYPSLSIPTYLTNHSCWWRFIVIILQRPCRLAAAASERKWWVLLTVAVQCGAGCNHSFRMAHHSTVTGQLLNRQHAPTAMINLYCR